MRLLIAALTLVLSLGSASAQSLISRESKFSVKETMDRLAAELEKRGIKPAARFDHAAAAKAAGMELAPTEVMLFGNPKLGTPLMQAAPTIGIDLPMRMLAWQDKAGKVWVGYVAPDTLKERHRVTGAEEQLKAMSGALDGLSKVASGQ